MTEVSLSQLTPIEGGKPPEEILARTVGGFGRWQLVVTISACSAIFLHSLNLFSSKIISPHLLNYTCAEENSSQCYNANGSACKKFIFFKSHSMDTFTEKLNLVCDYEDAGYWVNNSFHIGMVIGYIFIGWFADKYGTKITAMTFIPLYCLIGVFLLGVTRYYVLLLFAFCHGTTAPATYLLPKMVVCEGVGNKWRTLILGVVFGFMPLALMVVPVFYQVSPNINSIIVFTSVFPLLLLIPLLFYKNSLNYLLLSSNFTRGEDYIRRIAKVNRRNQPSRIRIIPIDIIGETPKPQLYKLFCETSTIRRADIALTFAWFLHGLVGYLTFVFMLYTYKSATLFGVTSLAGVVAAVSFCHLLHHRIIIGVCSVVTNILLLVRYYLDAKEQMLSLFSCFTFSASYATLDNLTPRMFSTDLRAQALGLCLSLFYVGVIVASLVHYYSQKGFIWCVYLILGILNPVLGTTCCFFFWKVHNRELPDFVIDAKNFKRYFKPFRYASIQNENEDEAEVASLHFT